VYLASIASFYLLIFGVGVWSSRQGRESSSTGLLLAGRKLPLVVGVLTMTATWVGGGSINGTAESVYDTARGLVWTQAPWGYALSMVLGGLFSNVASSASRQHTAPHAGNQCTIHAAARRAGVLAGGSCSGSSVIRDGAEGK